MSLFAETCPPNPIKPHPAPPPVLLLLLLIAGLFLPSKTFGQGDCEPVECHQIQVEVCQLTPTNECNVQHSACGGFLSCTQAKYLVRLLPVSSLPDDFDLQYRELTISINFVVDDPVSNAFSHLDEAAIIDCNDGFLPGSAISVEADKVTFHLYNDYSEAEDLCENASPRVEFRDGLPVDLFYIVVAAAPGETFTLSCGEMQYDSGGDDNVFCPGCGSTPGIYCLNCGVEGATVEVEPLALNEDLELVLEQSDDAFPCEVSMVLYNNHPTAPHNIERLAFVLNVISDQLMNAPVISVSDPDLENFEYTQSGSVHSTNYSISADGDGTALVAANGGSMTIGTIYISSPVNASLCASAEFSLLPDIASVSTSLAGCSGLSVNTEPVSCTVEPCYDYCEPPQFWFKATPDGGTADCGEFDIQLEFYAETPAQAQVYHMALDLEFVMDGGTTIKDGSVSVDWGCPTSAGCLSGDCVATTSNTLQYCFDVPQNSPHYITAGEKITLTFEYSGSGCVQDIIVRQLELGLVTEDICVLQLELSDDFPFCPQQYQIVGTIVTENDECVELTTVTTQEIPSNDCLRSSLTNCASPDLHYAICVCSGNTDYLVTPVRDDNHLNGVSTYDLLLISKHILGAEYLSSAYKAVAADANKSGNITSFDIIEFRKLILGIYTNLPDNTSWRFINPTTMPSYSPPSFPAGFVEHIDVTPNFTVSYPTPAAVANFKGIKVGDVNGSAVANNRPVGIQTIGFPAMQASRSSEYLTVPVAYTGDAPLEAFQLGLKFDPGLLEFVGTSQGEVEGFSPDMFGLTKAQTGEIRVAWFLDEGQPAEPIRPGDVLFYLTFKSKRGIQDLAAALGTDDAVLANRAWAVESGGQEYAVVSAPAAVRTRSGAESANGKLSASCRPNPTSGAVSFAVQTLSAQTVRVSIFSAWGHRHIVKDVALPAGGGEIEVPELAALPAGVYLWDVRLDPREKVKGRLVKE